MRPLGWKSPKDTLHDFIKYGVTYVWQTNNAEYELLELPIEYREEMEYNTHMLKDMGD